MVVFEEKDGGKFKLWSLLASHSEQESFPWTKIHFKLI